MRYFIANEKKSKLLYWNENQFLKFMKLFNIIDKFCCPCIKKYKLLVVPYCDWWYKISHHYQFVSYLINFYLKKKKKGYFVLLRRRKKVTKHMYLFWTFECSNKNKIFVYKSMQYLISEFISIACKIIFWYKIWNSWFITFNFNFCTNLM